MSEPKDMPRAEPEDFAAMLQDYGADRPLRLEVGQKVSGKVFHIGATHVFVSLSAAQEASMDKAELLESRQAAAGTQGAGEPVGLPQLGDTVEAYVVSTQEGVQLSCNLRAAAGGSKQMLIQAQEHGMPVEGTVTGVNKGGLDVSVGGARAFCPMGQVELHFVEAPESYIGKTLEFLVQSLKEGGRNVVLSRRALLQAQRAEKSAKLRDSLAVGQRLMGTVSRLATFGAFVDLGGMDGLIPMAEMGHGRVEQAGDVLRVGKTVEVEVVRMEPDAAKGGLRIGLSRRATLDNPWVQHTAELQEGLMLQGKVVRMEPFGAFVALFDGIMGLIHISELSTKRLAHPSEVLELEQLVTVRVLSVDASAKRVALSLKEATVGSGISTQAGVAVQGTVERIEKYGVFVTLPQGGSALLPASETGTPRGADLARAFPVGTQLDLDSLGADERGRMRVSLIARNQREERESVANYKKSAQASGSMSTFASLLQNKSVKEKTSRRK
jgi:small subunit ribosomal protein S1